MDYAKLSKIQKIAGFLIVIGPTAAAEVMKGFDNTQLELICREMLSLPLIPGPVQTQLMAEFAGVISHGAESVLGGAAFAQTALELAKGDFAASSILNRCEPVNRSEATDEIRQMEGRQLLNLVKSEPPQTVAFILSCLEAPEAATIVQLLPTEVREEVVERLGAMEPTSRDSLRKVANNLNRHFDRRAVQQGLHRSGGVKACADILNALDKDLRKTLLTRLEERNATLGAAIRKSVFSFDDMTRLSSADLQRVLRDVDSADLPIALKSAKPAMLSAVLGAMSKRAAAGLKDEVEMLAPPRARNVEAAQDKIIQVVRRLEEAEEITLESGGEDAAA